MLLVTKFYLSYQISTMNITKHKWVVCTYVVWNKEQCTASLSKHPHYFDCEEVLPWLWHYYYEATLEEVEIYYEDQREHLSELQYD